MVSSTSTSSPLNPQRASHQALDREASTGSSNGNDSTRPPSSLSFGGRREDSGVLDAASLGECTPSLSLCMHWLGLCRGGMLASRGWAQLIGNGSASN